MNNRQRFQQIMSFKPVNRLPMIEWAPWWHLTIARWKEEGLPRELNEDWEIRNYLGLDMYRQFSIGPRKAIFPENKEYGKGIVSDMDSYVQARKYLYPEDVFEDLYPKDALGRKAIEKMAVQQKQGDIVVWITLEGFFWFPRTLFGIEKHLYAFYDKQEVMHAMNQDLLKYNLRVLDQFCKICKPDFMTFAEDMSYNNGTMISKSLFDEFIKPYYQQIIPRLKEYDIIPFVDSDGNIEGIVSWFTELGVEGFLPLERQAGVDIVELRKRHPRLKMIGGYDKMIMSKGKPEMKSEFERILSVMKQGGYIPSVDHQTPPGVSFENYRVYLQLLREYSVRAAK